MQKSSILLLIKYYLPAILWSGIIFYFSSIPSLRYSETNVSLEIILRKGAHIFEYFILSGLVWRIFYQGHRLSLGRSVYYSLFIVSAYAASDEIHQSFVAGRAGKTIDVFLDILSIFLALQIITVLVSKRITLLRSSFIVVLVSAIIGTEFYMIEAGNRYEAAQLKPGDVQIDNEIVIEKPDEIAKTPKVEENNNNKENKDTGYKLPQKVLVKVPFTTQAPYANWDEYHEEACEEASLIMIKYFLDKKALNKEIAEKEIQDIIAYQIKEYGDYKDSSAEEIVRLARDYYKINNLKVVYDFKTEDIKKYLAEGKPLIVPAAGRKLGNPNFTGLGPLYHVLVLTGYNKDTIIANDPGTRKGENYEYPLDKLYSAIHDFPGKKEDIEQGRKAMIVIE